MAVSFALQQHTPSTAQAFAMIQLQSVDVHSPALADQIPQQCSVTTLTPKQPHSSQKRLAASCAALRPPLARSLSSIQPAPPSCDSSSTAAAQSGSSSQYCLRRRERGKPCNLAYTHEGSALACSGLHRITSRRHYRDCLVNDCMVALCHLLLGHLLLGRMPPPT